jgi:hypothetical protein
MRSLALLAALAAPAALLCDCSAVRSAQQSFQDSYHKGFRTSFKAGFIKSCTGQGGSEKLCGCVESAIESKYTDDQLTKLTSNEDEAAKAVRDAAQACRQKGQS